MAITLIAPALPTSNGETIIQSNQFVVTGHFKKLEFKDVVLRVRPLGVHLFKGLPTEMPRNGITPWTFYERSNMASGSESLATIVGIRVEPVTHTLRPSNTVANVVSRNLSLQQWNITATSWTPVRLTGTDGQIYTDVSIQSASVTVFMDPELGTYTLPTNGYQLPYEVLALLLKPVAAGAPDTSQLFKIISGRNPVE